MTLATLHEQLGAFLALGVPVDSQVGRWEIEGPESPYFLPFTFAVEVEIDGNAAVEIG
jgi:hypothetical protein